MALDNLDDLLEKFTEITELKAYANAQYNTIVTLQEKLTEANSELSHLRELLDASMPNLPRSAILRGSDQEETCKREIHKLSVRSLENVLSLEETKKLEIFTKLLLSIEGKEKTSDESLKNLTDEELMNVVEMADGKTSSK
jgi:hypothetical protein